MPRLGWAGAAIGVLVPLVAVGQWFAPDPYGFGALERRRRPKAISEALPTSCARPGKRT